MKTERQNLIESVIGPDDPADQRIAVLRAGTQVLRVRRWKRRIGFALSGGALMAVVTIGLVQTNRPATINNENAVVVPAKPAQPEIKLLTDDELLAMFPDTPVGLVKVGEAKRLIFFRAGDEARFVSKL